MGVNLLTKHHLKFLSLKGGCSVYTPKNVTLLEISCTGSYAFSLLFVIHIHVVVLTIFIPRVHWLVVDESDKLFEDGKTGFRDQVDILIVC